MFLVSARLSSSLPSSLLLLSFYLYYNTVHFYSEVMHIGKILETYHFFPRFLFESFSVFFFFVPSRAAIEPFYNRSGDLWYFSDGLFHIIDFSVILNYRKKVFLSLVSASTGADTIKSREIPFMCPYRLWNIFPQSQSRNLPFSKRFSLAFLKAKENSHWFAPFTRTDSPVVNIHSSSLHFRFCFLFTNCALDSEDFIDSFADFGIVDVYLNIFREKCLLAF